MSRWWRAYDEAVDDPKLCLLSDKQHRAWFNLCCLTSQNGGKLPPIAAVAFKLRMTVPKAKSLVAELVALGLFDMGDGGCAPHNWNARQFKSDVTDPTAPLRQKAYRDRIKNRDGPCNATVTDTDTRAETEQITEQSRAEARAVVSNSEKVLRTDLMEAFGPSRTPDLSRAAVWLSKGYSHTMIIEVVKELLARKPDISTLNYFDAALAERHISRPETPSERAEAASKLDMEKVVEMFVKTGVWSKYAGPEPGLLGCRAPPEILAKYGLSNADERIPAPAMRAMQ